MRKENFKEDNLAYFTIGYQKSGTIYTYETSSREIFLNLLKTHIEGVYYYQFEQKVVFDKEQHNKSLETLISKAKIKATKIAKKANRKIGKIVMIKENTPLLENTWYQISNNDLLNFNIVFEML